MLGKPNEELKEKILCACWGIWKSCNEAMWKSRRMRAREVSNMFFSLHLQWQMSKNSDYSTPLNLHIANPSIVTRSKPPASSFKVNCDATIYQDKSCSCWAFVVCDDGGSFVTARSFNSSTVLDLKLGEALAIKEALLWCL